MAESALCGWGPKSVIFFFLHLQSEQGKAGKTAQAINLLILQAFICFLGPLGSHSSGVGGSWICCNYSQEAERNDACVQLTQSLDMVLNPSPGNSVTRRGHFLSQLTFLVTPHRHV